CVPFVLVCSLPTRRSSDLEEMGLLYDSSLMSDEDCYELLLDGEPTGVVELPVEWVRDDAVYFMMNRFSALRPYTPPTDVLDIFRDRKSTRLNSSHQINSYA